MCSLCKGTLPCMPVLRIISDEGGLAFEAALQNRAIMSGVGAQPVRQMPLVCPGHNRGIVELQYSPPTPGGTFLVSACLDGTPMLRDGVTGDWIGSFSGHKGAVWGACISADAALVATAGADFTARLWDAVTGDCKAVLVQPHICKSSAFSMDGSRLLTAGNTPDIRIYDVACSDASSPIALLSNPDNNKKSAVKIAKYAGQGSNVVVSATSSETDEQVLSIWDVRSGSLEKKLPLSGLTKSAELSMNGEFLTVTSDDATVSVFSLEKMEKIRTVSVPEETQSGSFRYPGMDMLVTGGHDLTVRRHEVDGNNTVEKESNRGHHGPVWVMRFAPDGESYSSGSDDGTIRYVCLRPSGSVA